MVRLNVSGGGEPVQRELVKDASLVRNSGRENDVEGRDTIGGHHEEIAVERIHVSNFPTPVDGEAFQIGFKYDSFFQEPCVIQRAPETVREEGRIVGKGVRRVKGLRSIGPSLRAPGPAPESNRF